METVLIASLGDSPVVVTAMYDLLNAALQKEQRALDRLEVLYPDSSFAHVGYDDLIFKSLHQRCNVADILLDFEDVSEEGAVYDFLHKLYLTLDTHQKQGDVVYLSLAGGRKSMAALIALLAPLFTCVKELYHILDKDEGKKEDHFLSTRQIYDLPAVEQQRFLFPPHDRIKLFSIPYGEKQQLGKQVRSLLYAITEEQLDELWESDPIQAQTMTYYSQLDKNNSQAKLINVELTKAAIEKYREIRKFDATRAKNFAKCFEQMHYAAYLDRNAHDIRAHKGHHFHFYKRRRTAERPVFHTEPKDIKADPEAEITKVVVSDLLIEVEERTPPYTPLKDVVKKLKFPLETEKLEDAFPKELLGPEEHILIIPLATSPMVATQLYQLYIDKGYKVHSVILVHTQHADVRASVEIVCDAFESEQVKCQTIALKGWDDIDTPDACNAYQALLEETIRSTSQQNPSCQIELTISGGRKGMSALATFAAQQQGIHRVSHTVIQEHLSDKVFEETKVEELKKLVRTNNKRMRNDRLFLHAYKDNKEAFVLFKIPVLPVLPVF